MNWIVILNTLIYCVLGLVVFCVGFVVIDRLTPYNLWDQLIKEKNMALAIVIGAVSIGLCMIISAAVHS